MSFFRILLKLPAVINMKTASTIRDGLRIPPVRGLIVTHNAIGAPFELTDLKKWLRANGLLFKCEKIDVCAVAEGTTFMPELLAFAATLGVLQ